MTDTTNQNKKVEFAKGVSLPGQMTLNTKLYASDSSLAQEVELHLTYDNTIGRFVIDTEKTTLDGPDDDPQWRHQTFSPLSIFLQKGLKDEAVALADVLAEENPDSFESWQWKGVAHSHAGNHLEALKATEKAIELAPDMAFLHRNKAHDLHNLGRNDEALAALDKSLEMEPNFIYTHFEKGELLSQMGRGREAMKSYEKALTADGNPETAAVHREMIAKELGFKTVEEALEHVRKSQQLANEPAPISPGQP